MLRYSMQAWLPQAVVACGRGSLTQEVMRDVVIGSVVSCPMIALILLKASTSAAADVVSGHRHHPAQSALWMNRPRAVKDRPSLTPPPGWLRSG